MRISDWSSDVCSSDLEIRQIFVTDVAIGDRIGAPGEALAEPRALFWRIERFGGQFVLPEPRDQRFGLVEQRPDSARTALADEIIRVHAFRKRHEGEPAPRCTQARQSTRLNYSH